MSSQNSALHQPPSRPSLMQTRTLFALLILALSTLSADDFSQGLEAYHEERYAEAAAAFERSLQEVELAATHHNLALSYYQQQQPAKALWHLERALRFEPLNQSYRLKLAALRQQMGLYNQTDPWWRTTAEILSTGAWTWIISLSLWSILAVLSLHWASGHRYPLLSKLWLGCSMMALILSLTALSVQKTQQVDGLILVEEMVELRHAPARGAPKAGPARPGERIRVIDQHQNFLKVQTEAGIQGWIQASSIKKL